MLGRVNWQKILILSLLIVAPLFLAQCGSGSDSVPVTTVGPIGPTQPSGYFFDLQVTPSVIQIGGGATAIVHVWDSNGNVVSGATVFISYTGSANFQSSGATVTTGQNGWSFLSMNFKGVGFGGVFSVTAIFEDRTITAPFTLIAPGA